jgi:hypothetical protein
LIVLIANVHPNASAFRSLFCLDALVALQTGRQTIADDLWSTKPRKVPSNSVNDNGLETE